MPRPALSPEIFAPRDGVVVAKSKRKPKLSKKLREAINLLATGECKTQKAAAERVGMSYQWLSLQLGRDEVRAVLRERATRSISTAMPRAAERIIELMDSASDKVSLSAASHLLGIEGIKPAAPNHSVNISNNVTVSAGYILNATGKPEAEIRPLIDAAYDVDAT